MNDIQKPGDKYWSYVDTVWDSISIYDSPAIFLDQYHQVNPKVGYLFSVHWCKSEILNGGIHQFFYSPTGVLAPEAAEGFLEIGMNMCAAIIKHAMSFFGPVYVRNQEARIIAIDDYAKRNPEEWDPFSKHTRDFYNYYYAEEDLFCKLADRYAESITA